MQNFQDKHFKQFSKKSHKAIILTIVSLILCWYLWGQSTELISWCYSVLFALLCMVWYGIYGMIRYICGNLETASRMTCGYHTHLMVDKILTHHLMKWLTEYLTMNTIINNRYCLELSFWKFYQPPSVCDSHKTYDWLFLSYYTYRNTNWLTQLIGLRCMYFLTSFLL